VTYFMSLRCLDEGLKLRGALVLFVSKKVM